MTDTITKPAYRVPILAEVHAVPSNGCKVASTFSGTGGSCTGYRMAGYDVVWANEFVPSAQISYRANHPHSILDERDIRVVSGQDVLDATGLDVGELDLFDGSPPCQTFSMAGKREKGWGQQIEHADGAVQYSSDDLFFEYARLVRDLQPKVFIGENVSGLIRGVAKGYFKLIFQALEDCGYVVEARLLDASWLGVPQARQRLVYQGVRKDIGKRPTWPTPFHHRYSMADAIGCSPKAYLYFHNPWQRGERIYASRPAPTVTTMGIAGGRASQFDLIDNGKIRPMTISDLKALCSFPPDYDLGSKFTDAWTRLGNSVPPFMMKAVAEAVYEGVLKP